MTRSLSGRATLITVALLCFASCRSEDPLRADCAVPRGGLPPAQSLEAVLSIRAHAYWPEEFPVGIDVISLENAVVRARCDEGVLARSRLRRAIALLAAYGKLGERYSNEIDALGIDVGLIEDKVRQLHPVTFPILRENPVLLEVVVVNLLPELMTLDSGKKLTTACDWRQEVPAHVPSSGTSVKVHTSVSVAHSLDDVAESLDPQRWDNCGTFWDPPEKAAYLLTGRTSTNLPIEDPNPPPHGDSYSRRELYEYFGCGVKGCDTSFENYLSVLLRRVPDTTQTPPTEKLLVTYGLANNGWVRGRIGSIDPVGVEIDSGHMRVWEQSNRRMIYAYKNVRFDSAAANGMAQAILLYSELAAQLGEMACCLKSP